jgi:hypothetical protein
MANGISLCHTGYIWQDFYTVYLLRSVRRFQARVDMLQGYFSVLSRRMITFLLSSVCALIRFVTASYLCIVAVTG